MIFCLSSSQPTKGTPAATLTDVNIAGNVGINGQIPEPWSTVFFVNATGTSLQSLDDTYPSFLSVDMSNTLVIPGSHCSCGVPRHPSGRPYSIDVSYVRGAYCQCDDGYAGQRGSCARCPVGRYSVAVNASQSSSAYLASECAACLPGTYSGGGVSACTNAPVGRYVASYGAKASTACPPNAFCAAGCGVAVVGFWAHVDSNGSLDVYRCSKQRCDTGRCVDGRRGAARSCDATGGGGFSAEGFINQDYNSNLACGLCADGLIEVIS